MRWFRSGTKYGRSLTITGNNEKSGRKTAGKIGEILGKMLYKSEFITEVNEEDLDPGSVLSEVLTAVEKASIS